MPETSCTKRISVHVSNRCIKQLCNRKLRDFAMALWTRKVSGAFKKQARSFHIRYNLDNNRMN